LVEKIEAIRSGQAVLDAIPRARSRQKAIKAALNVANGAGDEPEMTAIARPTSRLSTMPAQLLVGRNSDLAHIS